MRQVYPKTQVKPCPFCGSIEIHFHEYLRAGTGIDHRGDTLYSMACYRCGASFPNMYNLETLVAKWNTRAFESDAGKAALKEIGE